MPMTEDSTTFVWQALAACRKPGVDQMLFFPHFITGPAAKRIRKAKKICARCSVSRDCLDYGLSIGCTEGIYGGMTPTERGMR